jgi:hypothetical protein
MADKPSTRILQAPLAGTGEEITAPGMSPGASYELSVQNSPLADPSSALPEPGRSFKNRAPAKSGLLIWPPGRSKGYAPDARPETGRRRDRWPRAPWGGSLELRSETGRDRWSNRGRSGRRARRFTKRRPRWEPPELSGQPVLLTAAGSDCGTSVTWEGQSDQ